MRRTRGFTLVEVVIAVSLVSMIMLGLLGAMRTFAQSGERIEAAVDSIDEFRMVPSFLESVLSTASNPARMSADASHNTGWFMGRAQELTWLGVMPARHGVGGYSHFRIALREGDRGAALILQVVPYVGEWGAEPEWAQAEEEVVADRIETLAFAYLASTGGEWRDTWEDPALPGWVRLSVQAGNKRWPLMIFRLHQARLT